MTNVKHSSASNEHYTPAHIVEAARMTLGEIDLDPASTVHANALVGAAYFFSENHDGFEAAWNPGNLAASRVFLNPPGGGFKKPRTVDPELGHTRSSQCLWWMKLMVEWASGRVESAVFLAFSIELLQVVQKTRATRPTDFPLCVPSERIAFDRWEEGKRVPTSQPSHANVIVCVADDAAVRERFREAFESIGEVFNDR